MPIVNNQAAADLLFKKIKKNILTHKSFYFGEVMYHINGNVFSITVECNEPVSMGDIIENLIKKDSRARVSSIQAYAGSFDWASDTYFKDCIIVDWTY